MPGGSGETRFFSSRPKLAWQCAGSLLLIVIGFIWYFAQSSAYEGIGALVVVALCTANAVSAVTQLRDPRPELVITPTGFTHRRYGALAWWQIDYVTIRAVPERASQRVIEVVVNDPAAFLAAMPPWTRRRGALEQRSGRSPITISVAGLAEPVETVIAAMHRTCPLLEIRI